jgi:hypothetical protein
VTHERRGSGTIIKWMKANGLPTKGTTDHDLACLAAATEVARVWVRGSTDWRELSARCFGQLVAQMTPPAWGLAYHVVAHVGDWGHRAELWAMAGLPETSTSRAEFEPGGAGWGRMTTEFQRAHPECVKARDPAETGTAGGGDNGQAPAAVNPKVPPDSAGVSG